MGLENGKGFIEINLSFVVHPLAEVGWGLSLLTAIKIYIARLVAHSGRFGQLIASKQVLVLGTSTKY